MVIPKSLLDEIRRGRVALFLGSGASKGAKNKKGEEPPVGNDLARMIYGKFLEGDYDNESLSYVSEIAISEKKLSEVQDYIKNIFNEFEPADFHKILPTFLWSGMATINFDRIIEKSYSSVKTPAQNLISIISDAEPIEEKIRSSNDLLFYKLHGCISRTYDKDVPLILTKDQFVDFSQGRERLYSRFKDLAYENTILFVGCSIEDLDIRKLLKELETVDRPRYYIVRPDVPAHEERFWSTKRITTLNGTFREFLETLNVNIPSRVRPLLKAISINHPIEIKFVIDEKMSEDCYNFLKNDADFVCPELPIEQGNNKIFYRGFGLGWYSIEQNLDVRRDLTETLLLEVILPEERERKSQVEFYAIKAAAGEGKTIFLRRLAWDAAKDFEAVCIFIREYGKIRNEAL